MVLSFLSKLEVAHPSAVEEVFSSETHAQIDDFVEIGTLPIFHDVFFMVLS